MKLTPVAALAIVVAAAPAAAQKIDPAARAAIVKAQQVQAAKPSYRTVQTTVRGATGETITAELIYIAPDRYHMRDLDGILQAQVIRIGKDGWMRTRRDPWGTEFVLSVRGLQWFRAPYAIGEDYKLVEAKALGPEQQPRGMTKTYEYTVSDLNEILRVRMWVLDSMGLPIRYEGEHRMGKDQPDRVRWDLAYDEPLKVERPAK